MEYLKALFAGTRPMSARTVEFHKYQMMEMNGLRSSANYSIRDQAWDRDDLSVAACLDFPSCATS